MNGFITRNLAGMVGLAALAVAGCGAPRGNVGQDVVDPCWPQRYSLMARREVNEAMAPQVQNGHVLDQTVWNYHFEEGKAVLTPGGLEHLQYLARRRPHPDANVYVQTALDVEYDPKAPEKYAEARFKLDAERVEAVQKYLVTYTAGRGAEFKVTVHDPGEVGMSAVPMNNSIRQMHATSRGSITLGGGGGASVSGGGGVR